MCSIFCVTYRFDKNLQFFRRVTCHEPRIGTRKASDCPINRRARGSGPAAGQRMSQWSGDGTVHVTLVPAGDRQCDIALCMFKFGQCGLAASVTQAIIRAETTFRAGLRVGLGVERFSVWPENRAAALQPAGQRGRRAELPTSRGWPRPRAEKATRGSTSGLLRRRPRRAFRDRRWRGGS